MAKINGMITAAQLADLEQAGYDVMSVARVLDSVEALFTATVFVECDINDLLTPPLCSNCGTLMDRESERGGDFAVSTWTCPDCGRIVMHTEEW